MNRLGVCYLISEQPGAHGVLEEAATTERMVYCAERSVGMRQSYEAMSIGIQPDIILRVAHYSDYNGEKLVMYKGEMYKVLRTWSGNHEYIDLTINKVEGNARV